MLVSDAVSCPLSVSGIILPSEWSWKLKRSKGESKWQLNSKDTATLSKSGHIWHCICWFIIVPHVFLCINPAEAFSPVHIHTLVKQQLSCSPVQRMAHHQLILQQATGASPSPSHRHLQPITLRVAPQHTNSSPLPLSVKRMTTPSTQSRSRNDASASSSSSSPSTVFASSTQTSTTTATIQPQPPPLLAAPQRRTSFPQNQPPPPPPPLLLPRLPQNPPTSLHRLSFHSAQTLSVQSGQVLVAEQELPVAEALVQFPYPNMPPPQTVAVDLKVHTARGRGPSSVSNHVLSGRVLFKLFTGLTWFAFLCLSVGSNMQSEHDKPGGEERFSESTKTEDAHNTNGVS